ncbi:cytosolic phospholipase A2 gamma-like [Aquarana catesbeiana]|uniref:cytosolic phospholipase A2 gamma-like n=1 Tax=Aquarana catesbeiana TaxID=8400 RepID=UPI003CC9BA2B
MVKSLVKSGKSLEGETKSVNERKRKVKETLSSLHMNVRENCDPPVIAVLGSGGGTRAMIGFLGTISKLAELNLLGAITYIAGISGSTWCMSSLYSNKNWSDFSEIEQLEMELCQRMKSDTERKSPWKKLKEKFLGDSYSLTDVWAYTFVFRALNSIDEGKLSSHKEMCEIGEVPYPIYSAVRKYKMHESKLDAWFEFTPHNSGFPAYKLYINTEHLGCRFKGGALLEQQAEHDLIYLQGLWGSALGYDWIWLFFHGMYRKLIKWLTEGKKSTETVCKQSKLQITKVPQIHKSWSECMKVVKNIASCFVRWKWGTTNNFLYKCKDKILENCDLPYKKHISLVDAGFEINIPYPLVLPPHRKVDLILSFDFSKGDPFATVKETAKYCKEQNVPFPKNIEESYESPPTKSCYIFEGDGNGTPDVMHFPQFNTQTCGDAKKIGKLVEKYKTRVCSYDEYMMEELLDIAKKNVKSSEEQIRVKIQQCVQRCNKRGMSQT